MVVADVGETYIVGGSFHNSETIGVRGLVYRSSNSSDGSFYGGQFSAETANPGSGSLSSMYSISGTTTIGGTVATTIGTVGTQINNLQITNSNAAITNTVGIRNNVILLAPITLSSVTGSLDVVSASQGIITTGYGSRTRIAASAGQIVNAFGNYHESIELSDNITNYTGIYIGDIALPSGIRRVFQYDGIGTNDPVVINYDGSVQIGTTTAVNNAKLSVVDGHVQSGQTTKPTISANANMGTGATATLNDATDVAGVISLDLGSANWVAGAQATITFNKTYANAPIVIITPANSAAATGIEMQHPYVTTGTTFFIINFNAAATNGNLMLFNYHVIETVNN